MSSIDSVMKVKLNNYNLAKGALLQMQRKRKYVSLYTLVSTWWNRLFSGNLSVRSLVDVVSKEDFVENSEYLETALVAVPK